MIEILFTVAALSLLIGAVGMFQSRTQAQSQAWMAREKIESQARRAIDRVASELTGVSQALLDPDPIGPLGASTLTFCRPNGVTNAGVVIWGTFSTLALEMEPSEAANNVDDDRDGLVDERQLVLTRDVGTPGEMSAVLCKGVAELLQGEVADGFDDDNGNTLVDEAGFCVQRRGDLLILRLTTQAGVAEGRTIEATVETRVVLRN